MSGSNGASNGSNGAKPALGLNPKDRLGLKKVRLSLVPPSSIIYQALAMEDGAVKYGPYNWRENKVIASIYIDAATWIRLACVAASVFVIVEIEKWLLRRAQAQRA